MTEWWERAYAGGPMVKVAGFPRPLYPPAAAQQGKKASVDGPDVEAYQRTVSRLGRWPWGSFTQAYGNAFALGSSGNVSETGVAGVQRQQHIDATGWLGTNTFNTLRSARCPKGPHEGEMAMDARAVELISQAYATFKGSEPAPDQTGTLRQKALTRATGQIGQVESPAGSNNQKYGSWYGANGVPWCAIFLTWCWENEGDSPAFLRGSRWAYVPYVVSDARAGRNGLTTTDDPVPGDLVCYDWEANGEYDHIGVFEKWTSGTSTFTAIEGNTSTSSNSNGGQVMRRTRNRGAQGTVFVRVAEP